MSILIVSVLIPLLTIAALAWFAYWALFSRAAGPRRWMRLQKLRRRREERLVRAAARRDREV